MRPKLLGGVAALALTGCVVLASVGPASADWYGPRWGWGPGAVAAGVIGGTVAAATSPLWAPGYPLWAPGYYDYYPGYAYGPLYAAAAPPIAFQGGDVTYCEAHFRSFNPATGMYLGYDGLHHPCP